MKLEKVATIAAGAVIAFVAIQALRANAAKKTAQSDSLTPYIFHPADSYAGTWTANGPLIPDAYTKQIWD
jgi:hypothetical protein